MQCNDTGFNGIALRLAMATASSKNASVSDRLVTTPATRPMNLENESNTHAAEPNHTDPISPTTTLALPEVSAAVQQPLVNAIVPAARPLMETPARVGRRLAQAVIPKVYSFTANKVRKTIAKRLAAHVLLPRATGSMHFRFKLDLVPMHGVKELAEEAGLDLVRPIKRLHKMGKIIREWKTMGPSATSRFCRLQDAHHLAWGGAKLKAPSKMEARQVARVMTLVAPPFTVTSTVTSDEESATFDGYLVTFNEKGEMTYPPDHEELWGEATKATERVLKKYAKRMLGDMFVEGLAVSQTFKKNLGPQFASSDSEYESESEED